MLVDGVLDTRASETAVGPLMGVNEVSCSADEGVGLEVGPAIMLIEGCV